MPNDDPSLDLLRQIRDLLVPVSDHYRPAFEESLRKRHQERATRLSGLVKGQTSRAACLLMDGTLERPQIRQRSKMDKSNLSKLVGRLDDAGMLVDGSDRKKPQVVFSPSQLREIFGD